MFVLMVTWFFVGQPPAQSQTSFDNQERCEAARALVIADGERLREQAISSASANKGPLTVVASNPIVPTVSAVCLRK